MAAERQPASPAFHSVSALPDIGDRSPSYNIHRVRLVMDREKRIREIAYSLWVAEGYPVGQNERHWRMAKQMLKKEEERRTPPEPGPPEKPDKKT
jgi:hypothetical protein